MRDTKARSAPASPNWGVWGAEAPGSTQKLGDGQFAGVPIVTLEKGSCRHPSGAKVETKNHHDTMKIKAPEVQIFRTPIKIGKPSLWNWTLGGFIMNLEFHGFLDVSTPSIEI